MLDEASGVPLYHQIKTFLREKVDSGEWKPHALYEPFGAGVS